jgi:predicted alpha/beta-hydrolase family hydrolase
MRPWVDALVARGVLAQALDLPIGRAEKAMTIFQGALEAAPGSYIGGHSYGGRVASMVAAQQPTDALILLSYPLHRPGHTEDLRTVHWPAIGCPVLVLSGESDPFARIELLRESVKLLRRAELVTYPGVGHGLLPVIDDAATRIVTFLSNL